MDKEELKESTDKSTPDEDELNTQATENHNEDQDSEDKNLETEKNEKEDEKLTPEEELEAIKDKLTSSDSEDLMLEIMGALNNTVEAIPSVGKYYTFVYNAQTDKQYDQHPLVAVTDIFSWGFRGINFHWQSSRNYTWEELTGQLYVVNYNELDDLLAIPYAKFITK